MRYFLAIDIGASSGRHIVGWRENKKIRTEEVYRFPNGVLKENGHLVWDVRKLFSNVVMGIMEAFKVYPEIEILSIDIADIDIGKNIGATLQMDQAQADKNIAQAKAEERRAMAIALEQEMKAKAQEARAKVIEAEAEVPRAMAEAFRSGNLGIMDYYKMKNVEADTAMRESIAKPSSKPEK